MKFLLAFLFSPVFVLAQSINSTNSAGNFTLTGTIKGLPDSTMVFLAHPGQTAEVLATGYAQKGKFNLFGKIASPDIYQLN